MIRRVALGVSANIFDKLTIAISQLLQVPILAAAWGIHVYGVWIILSTVPSFLAMGDFGLSTAAGVKMTMSETCGKRSEVICTFHSAMAAILGSSAVLMIASLAFAAIVPTGHVGLATGFNELHIRVTLFLLLIYGIASTQQSILLSGFRCAGLFALGSTIHGTIVLFECAVVVVLAVSGGQPELVAAGLLGSRLFAIGFAATILRRQVPWLGLGVSAARWPEVRSLVAPAGAVMLQPIANALYLQGSAIALGAVAGPAAVPAFTAVRTLSRIGLQGCLLLNTALMPEFSAATARADRRATSSMVLITIATSAIISLPAVLALALFGQDIVHVWSKGVITPSHALLLTMAASTGFLCLWYPLSNLLLAMQKQLGFALVFTLLSAVGVPMTYALARHQQAVGAGIVMATIDFTMLIVMLAMSRKQLATAQELREAIPFVWQRFYILAKQVVGRRSYPCEDSTKIGN